jgi:putative ABC transport system substrate-binding protein
MAKKSKGTTKRAGKPAKRTSKAKVKASRKKSKFAPAWQLIDAPTTGPKRIGFLIAAKATDWDDYIDAFTDRLEARGWVIGNGNGPKDVSIDYQPKAGAAGDLKTIQKCAGDFVGNVDLIVTSGTQAADACKTATKNIPIVFAAAGDPVGSGLVKNPTSPEANITGCCNLQTETTTLDRRIATMNSKLTPTKVAVIGNNNPVIFPVDMAMDRALAALKTAKIAAAPKDLGCFAPSDFASRAAIRAMLTPLQKLGVDVLLVCSDPVLTSHADDLVRVAHNLGMKTMHEMREGHGHHGGDQTYGPKFTNLFRKAAEMSDQILRGTAIQQIPVYTPPTTSNEQDPA